MEEPEKLAQRILADGGAGATAEAVDRVGHVDSPEAYEALRRIVLNEQNPEDVREKALNYIMLMVSRSISARREPGEMSEAEAGWIGELKAEEAVGRANAALCIMIYGGVETLGPLMDAMGIERDAEARAVMIEAGSAILSKCEGHLAPSAILRAEKAIAAIRAFHSRAMELPPEGARISEPSRDVSGSITMVKPLKR